MSSIEKGGGSSSRIGLLRPENNGDAGSVPGESGAGRFDGDDMVYKHACPTSYTLYASTDWVIAHSSLRRSAVGRPVFLPLAGPANVARMASRAAFIASRSSSPS